MATQPTSASSPSRSASVGQDLGRAADDGRLGVDVRVAGDHADVIAAEHLHKVEELLADQRLDGGRVVGALACAHPHEGMPSATIDLPDPVGVPRMTWSPAMRSMRASSWWGHSSIPRSLVHSKKRSKAWSGVSHGSGSLPSSGSHQVGESAPSEPNSASVPCAARE